MKRFKFHGVFLAALIVGGAWQSGWTAETANFSAQIGADMITVSAKMRYAHETPYVALDDIMQQIDGIVALQPDRIQANWGNTTAVLGANDTSVRLPDSSFTLANPIRQQEETVYIALADVPVFFSAAFNLQLSAVEQVDRPSTVELTPVEPEESVLEMPDSDLLESIEDPSAPPPEDEGEEEPEGEGEEAPEGEGEEAPEDEGEKAPEGEGEAAEGEARVDVLDLSSLSQVKGTLILDPGHGGQDTGALGGNGIKEKDITLSVALRVKKLLEENTAVKVQLTREEDSDLTRDNRTAVAQTVGGSCFVSLHCGFSVTPRAQGMSIFTDHNLQPADVNLSETSREQYEKRRATEEKAGTLAYRMAQALGEDSALGTVIVRSCPLVLQREIPMPVVLVEIAYLSNIDTATLLSEETYQEQVASHLAQAIAVSLK
ncbi:MAG: N-acetylmuramoyl-L-alanine amidase [Candidatus Hydrogenedentes bacterium]|nr:N-acetylmuramoyl-L-alanine amidase [Candidatus Hydrogenedentota bacterium]